MPLYHFKRDGDRTWLEPQETDYEGRPVQIPVPSGVDLSNAPKVIVCTVEGCGAMHRKPNLAATHFNKKHLELREDKETWREFTEEMNLV